MWFKVLSNGKTEQGLDADILKKKASWTKGAQDIVGAAYLFDNYTQGFIIIFPEGEDGKFTEVKQLDEIVATLNDNTPKRIKRKFKIKNNGYKYLYKYDDLKIENKLLEDQDGNSVKSQMFCFQLLREEDKIGEEVLDSEAIEKSTYITISISDIGDLSIKTD